MSKNKGLRLWLKNERKVQAEYEAGIKAVPATPVLNGNREERRGRLLSLDNKKPLEGLLSSQRTLPSKEVAMNPAAQAALDKEWPKLVDKGCWVENKVREYASATFSKSTPSNALSSRMWNPTISRRAGQCSKATKSWTKTLTMLSARRCLVALHLWKRKILDVLGSQPGYVIQQADAKQAYTQALFWGVSTWVRFPKNR